MADCVNSNSDESEDGGGSGDVAALGSTSVGADSVDDVLKGYLSKWTNYIHGWQPRYIVLKGGILSYYKSEHESDFGCRGSISLQKATIKAHEFDECRFDVQANLSNCVWYLRAESPEDKGHWIDVLQSYKSDASSSNDLTLKRHGSAVSLQSHTLSTTSGSSLKRANRNLKERLLEIETFKDILYGQIDTLQRYFDACSELNEKDGSGTPSSQQMQQQSITLPNGLNSIDFKGEAITFRATTAGVLTTLQHCLEVINQRDESWKRKLDREVEKRHKVEELYRVTKERLMKNNRILSWPGPDLEEGPHSTLPEDEFFDAVESGLDKIEEDVQLRVRLKLQQQRSQISSASHVGTGPHSPIDEANDTSPLVRPNEGHQVDKDNEKKNVEKIDFNGHWLGPEIENVCAEQLSYARQGVGEGGNGWQLFADEGEMKMYRREEEVNGMVIDPLKACHVVKGVTAREMCHYFYYPEYRNDWETTLEDMQILEKITPDTLVFLQTHKRIWPASQRDALFWSHMRRINDGLDEGAYDTWVVCNNSVDHDSYPAANTGKCVRIFLTVIFVCQTYLSADALNNPKRPVTRDDLTCRITYCSVVNPGGWAPAGVLRAVYKREYPKFLKRYTQYVIDQCKSKPIMFN